MKSRFGFYLSLHLSFILIVFFVFSPTYHFVHLINIVFVISFLYLSFTLFIYTKRGGFYDGIIFGFRRFRSRMMDESDYMEEWKYKSLPSEKKHDTLYYIAKSQTIALLTLLVILVLFYYF